MIESVRRPAPRGLEILDINRAKHPRLRPDRQDYIGVIEHRLQLARVNPHLRAPLKGFPHSPSSDRTGSAPGGNLRPQRRKSRPACLGIEGKLVRIDDVIVDRLTGPGLSEVFAVREHHLLQIGRAGLVKTGVDQHRFRHGDLFRMVSCRSPCA